MAYFVVSKRADHLGYLVHRPENTAEIVSVFLRAVHT